MVWYDFTSGMIPSVWYDSIGMVWFHWYGMIPLVWYGFLGMVWFPWYGMVSLVWHDSLGMVWFYWHGMIPLVWYGFIGMVWFHWYAIHWYGILPLVWYASISMVLYHANGIIPLVWYASVSMVQYHSYGMILNPYGRRKFWQSGRLVDPVQKSISMYVMEGSGCNIYCPSLTRASPELLHRWMSVAFVHINVNVIDFLAILIDCMKGRILE